MVEFQRNGIHVPGAHGELLAAVERTIRASGIAVPAPEGGFGQLKVVAHNIADQDAAAAKGFGTGLTFDPIESTISDYYEMDVELSVNGRTTRRSDYRHAIHSAVGNASGPRGAEPSSPSVAFARALDQMLLNFQMYSQQSGELSSAKPVASSARHGG